MKKYCQLIVFFCIYRGIIGVNWGIFAAKFVGLYLSETMIKKFLICSATLLLSLAVKGQNLFPDYRFKVLENNDTLAFAFAGGLNSAIWAEIDLNGNGIMDLIAYEKTTGRVLTFINNGTTGQIDYRFAPEYVSRIPELSEWVRSYDYDCDGDLDLLTFNISYTFNTLGEGAIRVYRNDFTSINGLVFTTVANELVTSYGTVIKVVPSSPVNLPAFSDIDGDGDMDILTFSLSSNYVEYHKNYSMDSTGVCTGFLFHADADCWGFFKLSGVANEALLNSTCLNIIDNTNLHSGSVLTVLDQGCDGDKDVINGDILGSNLLYLENGGSAASALITSQDISFPTYNVAVDYFNLPGAYYFDADNDGQKDMIISGFGVVGEDYDNVLFYKNSTNNCSNVFQYIKSRLIVEDMIDAGTSSIPVFFDVDNDGLMDLLVGNDFYYNINTTQKVAQLSWYKNTGSATVPEFTLMTNDFANISSLGILGAYPAFGDLDNDNDDDMLLGSINGDLIYFQNTGGSPANFVFTAPAYQGIDVGANSMPQIIDVDRDGLPDLLIGERAGTLNYYRNTGTLTNPVFTLITSNFGGVNVLKAGSIQGNCAPVLYDNSGSYELLVGSESGYIYYYTNIDGNLGGNFTLVDTAYEDIYEPKRAIPARFDLDGDQLADLMIGNFAGGLKFYSHVNIISVNDLKPDKQGEVYPNPVKDKLYVKYPLSKQCELYITGTDGRIFSKTSFSNNVEVDVSNLSPGLYFLQIVTEKEIESYKFIKQ
jgi:Secretion system C-terminal sorting domain/FG-GAP-like repeat